MRVNESEFLYMMENLRGKALKQKQGRELLRKEQLEFVCGKLKLYFKNYPECNVYLTGSIIRPGSFSEGSDIDIAVENYTGNRLDLFMELSELIDLPVDLIIMERCHLLIRSGKRGSYLTALPEFFIIAIRLIDEICGNLRCLPRK